MKALRRKGIMRYETKTESKGKKELRLHVRLSPEQKELINRAAAVSALDASDFVRMHVLKAAQEEISASEKLTLSNADRNLFLAALDKPPKANQAFKRAAAKYRQKYK